MKNTAKENTRAANAGGKKDCVVAWHNISPLSGARGRFQS
jgi:hypothetical protein